MLVPCTWIIPVTVHDIRNRYKPKILQFVSSYHRTGVWIVIYSFLILSHLKTLKNHMLFCSRLTCTFKLSKSQTKRRNLWLLTVCLNLPLTSLRYVLSSFFEKILNLSHLSLIFLFIYRSQRVHLRSQACLPIHICIILLMLLYYQLCLVFYQKYWGSS